MPPQAMLNVPQWVNWHLETRNGQLTKVPYQCGTWRLARSNDPTTWGTWAQAQGRPTSFAFTPDTGIMGIDLDHCIEAGVLSPLAQQVLRLCPTYTEISPSGAGLHLFGYGSLPGHYGKHGKGLELYDNGRFFTVTANRYPNTLPDLANIQAGVNRLLAQYFPEPPPRPDYPPNPTLEDREVISRVLRNPKYSALWYGKEHGATPSHGDASLLGYLKWHCNGDRQQMRRVYEQSPRCQRVKDKACPKWYERRRGTTYGELTLDFVLDR